VSMVDLLERLEKVTGPDRELDGAIQRIIGYGPHHIGAAGLTNAFTASVDAALTLVPKEWTAWELRSMAGKRRFSCDLSRLTECDAGEDWAFGGGPTPAIAICIAALKARTASEQKSDMPRDEDAEKSAQPIEPKDS
jgi:hypothetical protein